MFHFHFGDIFINHFKTGQNITETVPSSLHETQRYPIYFYIRF